ncbi:MAG: tetratricopeptide repeat protein [Bacteroidetes bacterium]|nr:tetratricopeptide repeat protein [Bacteroidota bacterium]
MIFKKCTEINANDEDAWFNLGFNQVDLKKYEDAIASYTKVLELHPEASDAYYNRGLAYYYLYDDENACSDWKRAIDLGDTDAQQDYDNICKK